MNFSTSVRTSALFSTATGYRIILEKELKKSNKEVGVGNRKIIDEINKHKDRISTAETMMLDKQMELSEYKAIKTKYEDKIRELETEMQSAITRPAEYLDFGFNILLERTKPTFWGFVLFHFRLNP